VTSVPLHRNFLTTFSIADKCEIDKACEYGHVVQVKTSNISYLRNHLSEVLACVREGETVLVLDRNKPVACLSPYAACEEALPGRLQQLQSQGFVTHSGAEKDMSLPKPMALSSSVDLVGYILEDRDREER